MRLFVTLLPEMAWANQTQGSVPINAITSCLYLIIALIQLQVATVDLLSLGTTTVMQRFDFYTIQSLQISIITKGSHTFTRIEFV